MDQRLKEAAGSGDIDSLYSIIQEDPYILDLIDQVPFVDTPLHLSAAAGHVHFSMEILRLKPSFAKKLNPDGFTPMHLALQNNQPNVVFRLMDADRDLVSVQGREGLTPLHIAAYEGKTDILSKFLVCCPKSIKELTIRKESALHIATKNGDIESVQILLEWVRQTRLTMVLNWADEEGNNIMHLAALRNQIKMVKLLINKVDMLSKNGEGLTSVDIMKEKGCLEDDELRKMLRCAGILRKPRFVLPTLKDVAGFFMLILSFFQRLLITDRRDVVNMSKEDRSAILVVSVLIATATYQALLDPPKKDGGYPFGRDYDRISIFSLECFRWTNCIAFAASMIEICVHLPSGIAYTLHLVLPLVICFTLLMLFWWSYFGIGIIMTIMSFILLSRVPIIRQKTSGDLKTKKMRKLSSLLKGSPSLTREVNEMEVNFKSSGLP